MRSGRLPEKLAPLELEVRMVDVARVHRVVERPGAELVRRHGPWRLEEGWWHGAPDDAARAAEDTAERAVERALEREYWDIELAPTGLYRIYREPAAGRWFADGVYD